MWQFNFHYEYTAAQYIRWQIAMAGRTGKYEVAVLRALELQKEKLKREILNRQNAKITSTLNGPEWRKLKFSQGSNYLLHCPRCNEVGYDIYFLQTAQDVPTGIICCPACVTFFRRWARVAKADNVHKWLRMTQKDYQAKHPKREGWDMSIQCTRSLLEFVVETKKKKKRKSSIPENVPKKRVAKASAPTDVSVPDVSVPRITVVNNKPDAREENVKKLVGIIQQSLDTILDIYSS